MPASRPTGTSQPTPAGQPTGAFLAETVVAWWEVSEVRRTRDQLPWRQDTDAWAILVSEVMLAQTQVSRVEKKYAPFLDRFPTPAALVAASLADVLELWSGLGYPRRALALKQAAGRIMAEHEGCVPQTMAELLALPGIGDYTARAVLAFAFDVPVMPVDTNIARVIARAHAGETVTRSRSLALASQLTAGATGGTERARAFMDLGATICRASDPSCELCPLGGDLPLCRWRRSGSGDDPARGTWGVSARQSRFEGSDRQGRGRLLRAAAASSISVSEVAAAAGWPEDPDRALQAVDSLVEDGLLEGAPDGGYRLPG